jgi:hypothetical protein
MPVSIVAPEASDAVRDTALPPLSCDVEPPLFGHLEGSRSGHRIGGRAHERMFHFVVGLFGTGVVFAILYASMLLLE